MRYWGQKSLFLLGTIAFVLWQSNVMAQDVAELSPSKDGGKFSDWVQKQKENYQHGVEQVSESQFATVIGDGVGAAQSGISYAQGKLNEGMNFMNNTMNSALNSSEYKMAMLSQQIASGKKAVSALKDQKKESIANLEANAEIERTVIQEKIAMAEESRNAVLASYKEELAAATGEDEKERIKAKIAETEANTSAAEELKAELEKIDKDLQKKKEEVENSYDVSIENQSNEVAEMVLQLEDMVAKDERVQGKMTAGVNDVMENTMSSLYFSSGDGVSLQDRKEQERKNQLLLEDSVMSAANVAVGQLSTSEDKKEEQEQVGEVSTTLNGKSEAVQLAIEGTVAQMDALQNYLEIELKALESKVAYLLTRKKDYRSDGITPVIDICSYEEKKSLMDGMNSLAGVADGVKNMGSQVTGLAGSVDEVKQGVKGDMSGISDFSGMGI